MAVEKTRFFVALLPPVDIQNEITEFKKEIQARFGSKKALNAPPHITLHMPFLLSPRKEAVLRDIIHSLNEEPANLTIQLEGFAFFEPRVVFVSVRPNPTLAELQKQVCGLLRKKLGILNANYKGKPFHPHITIGFKDLKKTDFPAAKRLFELRSYSRSFTCNRVTALRHNGEVWEALA